MTDYPFDLITPKADAPVKDNSFLARRPFLEQDHSLKADAGYFAPGAALADAINTAIAVGKPLLLTGEPGTGKTQTAYHAAWRLGVECIHFQVKSESTARDLLYDYDMVRYFRDAHLGRIDAEKEAPKSRYLEKRPLWRAFELAREKGVPQVLLIDEIDKAPRDFPNDLLHELDQMEFTIIETGQETLYEYRVNGVRYMIKVQPKGAPAYYLLDSDGDGTLDVREDSPTDISVPRWVLFSW